MYIPILGAYIVQSTFILHSVPRSISVTQFRGCFVECRRDLSDTSDMAFSLVTGDMTIS